MNPLNISQDAVKQDHQALSNEEIEYLHMFFSPNRIPVGLTDKEARICILLYPLRKAKINHDTAARIAKITPKIESDDYKDSYQKTLEDLLLMGQIFQAHIPQQLPQEFSPSRTMTRGRFKRAVTRFLEQVAC